MSKENIKKSNKKLEENQQNSHTNNQQEQDGNLLHPPESHSDIIVLNNNTDVVDLLDQNLGENNAILPVLEDEETVRFLNNDKIGRAHV
jgi:hypothetical protein